VRQVRWSPRQLCRAHGFIGRDLATSSKCGGSWTVLVVGCGWCCKEAGGCGGHRHFLGELISVSGCRPGLFMVVIIDS
jgi:hypothetical protein